MNENEWAQFQRTRGQQSHDELTKLFESKRYAGMSDKNKIKAITDVYDNAFDAAKDEMINNRPK